MAGDANFSEEYIAELLKKDAQKVSASYARNGIYDVLPKRPVGAAPKPNTRFLQNIIRSTDNHNAALKQKELDDAAHKLRALARTRDGSNRINLHDSKRASSEIDQEQDRRKRKRDHGRNDINDDQDSTHRSKRERRPSLERDHDSSSRHRRKKDRNENHERGRRDREEDRRRHRTGAVGDQSEESDYTAESSKPHRSSKWSRRRDEEGEESKTRTKDNDTRSKSDSYHGKRHTNHDRDQYDHKHRPNHKFRPDRDEGHRSRADRKKSKATERQSSLSASASDSQTSKKRSTKTSKPSRSHHSPYESIPSSKRQTKSRPSPAPKSDLSDDDPLSSFLGPALPSNQDSTTPKIRGRGLTSFISGTEARFSASYDPHNDITPDLASENEDWDQALEALRDRQKFRQAGADRLLAAGFTQEEVTRMERGGERDESDVRWTKKGQAREWDRGKTLDENGDVAFAAEGYGRLT